MSRKVTAGSDMRATGLDSGVRPFQLPFRVRAHNKRPIPAPHKYGFNW